MKIGIVCYPSLGGSGIVATELGHQLGLQNHEVHFITYEIPFRLRLEEDNIFFHEVEINQYDLFKYPDYALTLAVKMANVAKQNKLDILHVHYAIPHATSAFLTKQLLGPKSPAIITTLHGTDITLVGRDPAYFDIVKFSIEQSDGVTAVSNQLRNETREIFDIEREIQVIPNFFIPKPEFMGRKPMRDEFVKGNEKLLIHSSNYRSVKRAEDVVRIFKRVQQQVPSKLLFLGSGAGIESIHQRIDEYGLGDQVIFLGKNRDIDPYVASADLFLLPSEQESFGLVALEAMAYGVPVIASNVGGLPELVTQGECGFLSPVGDVESMANDAIKLLTDDTLYQKMSHAGIKRARETYCVEKILPQYVEFYQKTIQFSK